jgi:hypothetical protein
LKKGQGGTPASRQKTLDELVARCRPGWVHKKRAIEGCLGKAVDLLLSALGGASDAERERLTPLLELLRREKILTLEQLRDGMIRVIRETIVAGSADAFDLEGVLQLLFTKEAAVMFELAEWAGTLANHPSVWHTVNQVLLQRRTQSGTTAQVNEVSSNSTDLFGEPCIPSNEKMPERRIPLLGNVKLRSHAASKPCQARYGFVEGNSCPVGLGARGSLAGALAWLTALEREGKTFRDISNACGFPYPALLLTFPDPLPPEPAAYADMFAAPPDEEQLADQEGRFVAAAEGVTKQLQTPTGEVSDAVVKVFALGKRAGDARTKLLLSRQYSARRIIEKAGEWRKFAAHNVPPIFIWQFGADRKPHKLRCNRIPSPAQVSRCLNLTWLRNQDDLRSSALSVFDFGSELTLFLDSGPTLLEATERALRLGVCQWLPLLLRVGQQATLRLVYPRWPNEQLLLPSILGLLLAKLGCLKEVYMNDVPYWIGRLLAVADRFHLHYCRVERDERIPRGPLIGNATMPTALENPLAGLARLAERIPLYQRVADDRLRRESAEVTSHIDPTKLSDRATDEEKAQMLLGYLARPDLLEPSESKPS